jgi:hypothetical protein
MREWGRTYYPIYRLQAAHMTAANVLSPEDCEVDFFLSKTQ